MPPDASTAGLPPSSEPAGLWFRFLAMVIDFVIIAIPCSVVANLIVSSFESDNFEPNSGPRETSLEDFAGYPLFTLLFSACFAAFWYLGRSPGMAAVSLRAENKAPARRLSLRRAALRGFLTAIFLMSCLVLVFAGFADSGAPWNNVDYGVVFLTGSLVIAGLVGYFAALRDGERRTLQDRFTGVRVIRVSRIFEGGGSPTFPAAAEGLETD